MMTIEQLIEESRDERLERLPLYARTLIHQLALRLESEHRDAVVVRAQAEEEVTEARALLTQGPEDSDTFVDLPRSKVAGYTDEPEQRALGKGISVEFRRPSDAAGEGFIVYLKDDQLHVSSMSYLAVLPVDHSTVVIEQC